LARDLVLGVDAGHTVTKAVLFDATGRPVARGSGMPPLSTPRPHWVERDMDAVWRTAYQAVAACLAEAGPEAGRSAAAVGLAGHGDGLYAVDERGLPVRAGIVAMDTRAEAVLEEWRGTPVWSRALELSGTVPFAGSPAALLAWLARHEPKVLQQSRWLLSCKDWLRLRLTGSVATDPTDAGASFTDMRRGGYSPELLDLYGLGALAGMLPPVLACDAVSGTVTPEAAALTAGTPVVTGAHDVDAAALGIGGTAPGELSLIAGSFSINQVVSDQHRRAMQGWWERVDFLRGAEEAAYRELTAPDTWIPYPDTEPVLRTLRERGLRVGIVSDFAWDLRTHLAHHGLDALIDTCVIFSQSLRRPRHRPPRHPHGRRQPDPRRRSSRLRPAHLHPALRAPHR
jgi:L-xylulokinase